MFGNQLSYSVGENEISLQEFGVNNNELEGVCLEKRCLKGGMQIKTRTSDWIECPSETWIEIDGFKGLNIIKYKKLYSIHFFKD